MNHKKLAIFVFLMALAFTADATEYTDMNGQIVQTNANGQYYDASGQLMQGQPLQYGQQSYQNQQQYGQQQQVQYAPQQDTFQYTQQQRNQQDQLTLQYQEQMLLLKQQQQQQTQSNGYKSNSNGLGTLLKNVLN